MSVTLPPLTWGYMVLAVADLERLRDWYCRVLGFELAMAGAMPEAEAQFVVLKGHGMRLELCRRTGSDPVREPTPAPPHHLDRTGWTVFTLNCPDLHALGQWLAVQGAEVIWSAHSLAPGICSTLLRDPEGNLINLFGPQPQV